MNNNYTEEDKHIAHQIEYIVFSYYLFCCLDTKTKDYFKENTIKKEDYAASFCYLPIFDNMLVGCVIRLIALFEDNKTNGNVNIVLPLPPEHKDGFKKIKELRNKRMAHNDAGIINGSKQTAISNKEEFKDIVYPLIEYLKQYYKNNYDNFREGFSLINSAFNSGNMDELVKNFINKKIIFSMP